MIVEYDPDRVRNIDADVAIGDVADTVTYRQLWEDRLTEFLQAGHVPFEVFLEESSHPRAQALLARLRMHYANQAPEDMIGAALTKEENG